MFQWTAYNLLAVILIFAGLEIAARTYFQLRYHRQTNGSLVLNFSPYVMNGWESDMRLPNLVSNRLGFPVDYDIAMPKTCYRIFLLGGSFTIKSVEDYHLSVGYRIKQRLEERLGSAHVEFIPAGAGGVMSFNELIFFVWRILRLDPDMIIICDGHNDILTLNTPKYHDQSHEYVDTVNYMNLPHWRRSLIELSEASRMVSELRRLTQTRFYNPRSRKDYRKFGFLSEYRYYPDTAVRYAQNLRYMGQLCHANQASVVYIFQPTITQVNKPLSRAETDYLRTARQSTNFFKVYDQAFPAYYSAMTAVARELHAPVFNANEWFDDLTEKDEVFGDDCHLTDESNDYFARQFVERLTPLIEQSLRARPMGLLQAGTAEKVL